MIDEEPPHPDRVKILTHVDYAERRVKRAEERIRSAISEHASAQVQREQMIARLEAWDRKNPPAQMALSV